MKLKQVFSHKKNEEEQQIEIIKNSEFFDTKWYLEKNPDVKARKMSAARHYLKKGWQEKRNPSPKFKTKSYLKKYPECNICPLVFEHNRNGYVDLAICAIMKNEGPYVKEWIDYHRLVGVKRFYIYNNESTDNLYQVLLPYINQGVVVCQYVSGNVLQKTVYNECLKEYGSTVQWMAFIDADEFIVPKEKDSIPEFLKDYEAYSGIGINWINFDSNGHKKKPMGGVLENYTRVHYNDDWWKNYRIKSIVKPKDVKTYNVHFGTYIENKFAVDENKNVISNKNYIPYVSVKKIQINHYYCKSEEEATAKIARGAIQGTKFNEKSKIKSIKPYELNFDEYKYDYSIYKYLAKLNPKKAIKITIKSVWLKILNTIIKIYYIFKKDEMRRYIDEDWYFAKYPEAKKSGLSAREHYLQTGWLQGYNPSDKFDTNFYLTKYPSVAKVQISPLLHYVSNGKYEKKQILPDVLPTGVAFKENLVLKCFKTMKNIYQAMILSIAKTKKRVKISNPAPKDIVAQSEFFDEKWYSEQYSKVDYKKISPQEHYRTIGWKKGNNPSEKFDTKEYLKKYPECKICPLVFEYNRNSYTDLAICAIMKNEAPRVKEWIDYHRLVGVKRFYIYDNESTDNLEKVLMPYIEEGIIVYKYYPGEARQIPAYEECLKNYGDKIQWLAFIDGDEFIIPVEKNNIPEFLEDYKKYPAVVVDWIYYDSNNHKNKPKGGLLENYTRVQYDPQIQSTHRIKSIVHPLKVKKVINPHYCTYIDNKKAVDECYRKVGNSYTNTISVKKIRINHYYCKSIEEYREKIERGRATQKNGVKRSFSIRDCLYDDYKYDYAAFRYVIKLKPNIAIREFFRYLFLSIKNTFIKIYHPFNKNSVYKYFDKKWYLKQYPDAKESGLDPIKHYLTIGWKKGYNFNSEFDSVSYLNKYPKATKEGATPLYHFLRYGRYADEKDDIKENSKKKLSNYELIEKSEYFDKKWYLKAYPEVAKGNIDPIEHYLTTGWKKGYNPSKKFDGNAYLENYQDVKKAEKNPLLHYLQYGMNGKRKRQVFPQLTLWEKIFNPNKNKILNYQLIEKSEYFDAKYYRLHNPKLWLNPKDMLTHYLTIGWLEGKNPSAKFDGNRYLADYPDVDKAGVNPLIHYLEYGMNEHRNCYPVGSIRSKIRYALEYPIRVKEEYDRLTAEIKALENMK